MADDEKPTSLRAYARQRGVSAEAVSKAITAGRLSKSIALVDGQPKIASVDLANREWAENTRARIEDAPALKSGDMSPAEALARYNIARALREEAAARREASTADVAEIDARERKGQLVPVDQARADVFAKFTVVRTRILGVPSMVAQRLPKLASEVVPVLVELLREVLEELAIESSDDEEEEEE